MWRVWVTVTMWGWVEVDGCITAVASTRFSLFVLWHVAGSGRLGTAHLTFLQGVTASGD